MKTGKSKKTVGTETDPKTSLEMWNPEDRDFFVKVFRIGESVLRGMLTARISGCSTPRGMAYYLNGNEPWDVLLKGAADSRFYVEEFLESAGIGRKEEERMLRFMFGSLGGGRAAEGDPA